jgi:hypothetical protein
VATPGAGVTEVTQRTTRIAGMLSCTRSSYCSDVFQCFRHSNDVKHKKTSDQNVRLTVEYHFLDSQAGEATKGKLWHSNGYFLSRPPITASFGTFTLSSANSHIKI